VLREERLAHGQHSAPVPLQKAGALEKLAATSTADEITDVVADDRPGGRNDDHKRCAGLPMVCEHAWR